MNTTKHLAWGGLIVTFGAYMALHGVRAAM
jgi:hypothetical protein